MITTTPCISLDIITACQKGNYEDKHQGRPVFMKKLAHSNQHGGGQGEILLHVHENLGDLGNHEGHQKNYHAQTNNEHQDGIGQGRADFSLQGQLLLSEISQSLHHQLQSA